MELTIAKKADIHEQARQLMDRLNLKYNRVDLISLDEYYSQYYSSNSTEENEEIANLLQTD
jgi:hypothetical protein